ncbi:O-antigen ligase family protein [Phragmitibacter flavus]|uniref:O-antigen ligase family protein n=1 Tax=Phragmitibacter flavus TaxID=2576071 RepID=A0A5R8KIF8_9BACT|nr:O-antigen ligase family protein [Phragmitibacter flavus]TLD72103.1 O-antigen ligase family protein [Phragmitibacter flavus]
MVPPPDASKDDNASVATRFLDRSSSSGILLGLLCIEGLGIKICQITLTVLLCGYFLMANDWIQLLWFTLTCPIAFLFAPWSRVWPSIQRDRFLRFAGYFLVWMTVSSFLAQTINTSIGAREAVAWLFGTALLVAFALLVWHSARDLSALQHTGWWIGMGAALAALISMLMFYVILPGHVFGERLCNWFVYGGLNPVATGLTFGFASMWLTCARNAMQSRNERLLASIAIVILIFAVFFTRSRGAVLALIAGHAALIAIYGLRANRTPVAIFVAIALTFQISGPLVAMLSTKQVASRVSVQSSEESLATGATIIAYSNPARELINRGDNGRFELYRSAFASLQGPRQWLFGIGQWSTEHLWKPCTGWNPEHLHSAFLATLVHGGLVGFSMLLVVFSIGSYRAYQLAKAGQGTWLVLLACGSAGMLFDGQTFSTFTSIPRMEVLLVIFPLIVSASAYHHLINAKQASVKS